MFVSSSSNNNVNLQVSITFRKHILYTHLLLCLILAITAPSREETN